MVSTWYPAAFNEAPVGVPVVCSKVPADKLLPVKLPEVALLLIKVFNALVSTSYFNAVKAAFVPLVTVVNTPLVAVALVIVSGFPTVPSPVRGADTLD